MKVTFCILILVLLVAADARKGKSKRRKQICGSNGVVYADKCEFAKAKKAACGSDNPLTMVHCKKDNGDTKMGGKRRRGGGKKKKEGPVCGDDGMTYDNRCDLDVSIHCRRTKIVHLGACGDCAMTSVCPNVARVKKNMEKRLEQVLKRIKDMHVKADERKAAGKRTNHLTNFIRRLNLKKSAIEKRLKQPSTLKRRKATCGSDGTEYDSRCDFNVARCEKFIKEKSILKATKCMKN